MTISQAGRRAAITWAATFAGAALLPLTSMAQGAWPNRPIKLIVPFAAGGGTDVIARTVATKLSARLGQPVIVDNRVGAGGVIGTDILAKSQPDGYSILFTTTAHATGAATGTKLPYDPIKDFTPIGAIGASPMVVVVAQDSKYRTMRELVDAARLQPKAITHGSAGFGSFNHLAMELMAYEGKMQLTHVPYKGAAPALTDLLGGNITLVLGTPASINPFLQGGKVRQLALTSARRSPFSPDVPTVAESGIPTFHVDFSWGLMAPARTPAPIIKRITEELNAVLATQEMRDLLAREGALPTPTTPEEYGDTMAYEVSRWNKAVKEANIKME